MVCNARAPETEIEFDGKVFLSPDVIPGNVQVVTSGRNAPVRNLRFRTHRIKFKMNMILTSNCLVSKLFCPHLLSSEFRPDNFRNFSKKIVFTIIVEIIFDYQPNCHLEE